MGAGEVGPDLDVPSVCQNVFFGRMRLEDLVRIRGLSLTEKTRLAYLEGFETEFRRRWTANRPWPKASGRTSLIRSKRDVTGDWEGAMPRCRQPEVRRGSVGP